LTCCASPLAIQLADTDVNQAHARTYHLRAETSEECDNWLEAILEAQEQCWSRYRRSLNLTLSQRIRLAVAEVYEARVTQVSISVLLLLNFVLNIVQTEIEATQGTNPSQEKAFDIVNGAFRGFCLGVWGVRGYGLEFPLGRHRRNFGGTNS